MDCKDPQCGHDETIRECWRRDIMRRLRSRVFAGYRVLLNAREAKLALATVRSRMRETANGN